MTARANAGDVPGQSPAAISCRHLAVSFGKRLVLDDVSLEVPAGTWTAVVGPNGCGKSTLLRTLAGLRAPQKGTIALGGRALTEWPRRARARHLAWLSQQSGATDLTAAEVISLGRVAHGGWLARSREGDDAAIARAMEATGTGALAARRVSTLSGGERQRVHLARTLAVEAPVLLLDEPTTHLDPPHQEDVARLLREQARVRGACVLSAIHDLSLAMAADRLIVLGHQALIGHGSVRDALEGDWLSTAFRTPVKVVEHGGVHLWRPALEPPPGEEPAEPAGRR